MKFLLDQGLPRSAAGLLRERDFDAAHAAEIGLTSAADLEILTRGRLERRVIVTLDADFHALMALSAATAPSVIRIRRQGLTVVPLVELILDAAFLCGPDLEGGALVSIRADAIKVHRLPVVRSAEE
jgi:predicted nuclease of predicted toxin-antitoxin system